MWSPPPIYLHNLVRLSLLLMMQYQTLRYTPVEVHQLNYFLVK